MEEKLRRSGVVTARELLARERDAATGTRDDATGLGGLLRRGSLLELIGRTSSGRMSLILSELAEVTARGDGAVFIDLGDHLDPASMAAAGIEPRRVLWVRPRDLKSALTATEIVLPAGLPLVVLDLGSAPIRGRRTIERGRRTTKGPAAAWTRLAQAAKDFHVALLLSTPYRISGSAARTVVEMRRRHTIWSPGTPPLLEGLETSLHRIRSRNEKRVQGHSSLGTLRFWTPWSASCRAPEKESPNGR